MTELPPDPRQHALDLLRELDRLIEALSNGCAEPAASGELGKRTELLQRAEQLKEKLLCEIENLPSARDDDSP